MKDEYVLYLDESEFKSSKTFAIAGIAVKKDDICILEQGLEEIKRLIWDEQYIIDNAPVLHCTELQKVFDNRRTVDILGVKEEYQDLIKDIESNSPYKRNPSPQKKWMSVTDIIKCMENCHSY